MSNPTIQQIAHSRMAQRRKEREGFKASLLKELGIEGHPKADMLFGIAWSNGHASGFHEVKANAEELVPLIIDDAVSVLRDQLQRTQATASIRLTAMWRYRGMVSGLIGALEVISRKLRQCDYVMARSDLLGVLESAKSDYANAIGAEGDPESSRIEEDRLMAERYRALRLNGCRLNGGRTIGLDELDAAADMLIGEGSSHD